MPKLVVAGAKLQCPMGTAPASLALLPSPVQGADQIAADVQATAPQVNIPPFGMCQSMSNPQVAAATAAAQGVLTPQPCMPATAGPWTPGSSLVTLGGKAALTADSKCTCSFGGQISITDPGQTLIDVD